MKVHTTKASIRYSTQLAEGPWATVELGAEASVDANEDPNHAQATLYAMLKDQLHTLWPVAERLTTTTPAAQASLPTATPAETVCPHHNKAKESRDGTSLYCPAKMADGTYCTWAAKKGDET
jgi:hypothetical protein